MPIHVISAGHWRRSLLCSAAILLALAAATPGTASAQTAPPPLATAGQTASADAFTRAEIETLVAPYALYPDALLAQLLPASAYPVDIVQVSRWLAKNKASADKGDFTALDAQSWDPSVKSLARFPTVIDRLNTELDATTDLGDAFVNQPDDVAAVIQALRLQAQKAGTLQSTPQQRVTVQAQDDVQYVVIEPTDPEVLYVPDLRSCGRLQSGRERRRGRPDRFRSRRRRRLRHRQSLGLGARLRLSAALGGLSRLPARCRRRQRQRQRQHRQQRQYRQRQHAGVAAG